MREVWRYYLNRDRSWQTYKKWGSISGLACCTSCASQTLPERPVPAGNATSLCHVAVVVSSLCVAALTFLCTVSLYRLLLSSCFQFVLRRPTGQVPLLLLNLSFSSLHFTLFLYEVPSAYSSSPSQSVIFIYFYIPRFSPLSFYSARHFLSYRFVSSLPQFPPSSVLSHPLVYTFFSSVVTSVLAFTYYFLFTGSFHSLFSDSFSFCAPCISPLPAKTPHYQP